MPHGNLGMWYVYNISFSSIICLGFCFFPCVCVWGGGGIYCYVVTKNWNPMFTSWETCTQFLVCNCRLLSDFTDNTCLRIVRQDMQYRVTKKIVVGMEFLSMVFPAEIIHMNLWYIQVTTFPTFQWVQSLIRVVTPVEVQWTVLIFVHGWFITSHILPDVIAHPFA